MKLCRCTRHSQPNKPLDPRAEAAAGQRQRSAEKHGTHERTGLAASCPLPRALALTLGPAVALVLAGCGPAVMSVEEAKKVTASFQGAAFVPPPRTIQDVTAILDQQKAEDPVGLAEARRKLAEPAPPTKDPAVLARFFYERGTMARDLGWTRHAIEDLGRALEHARQAGTLTHQILVRLGSTLFYGGNWAQARAYMREAATVVPSNDRGWLFAIHQSLVYLNIALGDLKEAERALGDVLALEGESRRWTTLPHRWRAHYGGLVGQAQGNYATARGDLAKAEAFYRRAIASASSDPTEARSLNLDRYRLYLAGVLGAQGRLLEAENEARSALLGALRRNGRNAYDTAMMAAVLGRALSYQQRWADAEALTRVAIEIYEKVGVTADAVVLNHARFELLTWLVNQGRYREARDQYEAIRRNGPELFEQIFRLKSSSSGYLLSALTLLRTGAPEEALALLQDALDKHQRLHGDIHRWTAQVRAGLGMAYAETGDRRRALTELGLASRVLFDAAASVADEESAQAFTGSAGQFLPLVLRAYIELLADVRGTPLEREAGIDAAAEAFRLADLAGAAGVQRALNAAVARASVKEPALADLVRREQDAVKRVTALEGILANRLSAPTGPRDAEAVAGLRAEIETLRRARQALAAQITREFPSYARLLNPPPVTVEEIRAALRPGEALVATHVGAERTLAWAIPRTGPVSFASAPLGQKDLEARVATLRHALDPNAKTLAQIPEFDVAAAHELYRQLLEPVSEGWRQADSLLVVAQGPLAHLSFALLPMKPVTLGPETGVLFSNYRAVPWLIRTHAVTVLPSAASLVTLRALPAGAAGRRPFVGFGDPWFSPEQARQATVSAATLAPAPGATTVRGADRSIPESSIALRATPRTRGLASAPLGTLPRLPETADEIRAMALAMNADPAQDVFTGARASEKTVKAMDLSRYRVIAFATHGLVPGDLDGLTQPALALTAPGVAGDTDGDGLLTMEEILALRLNADWAVLSACNTASGEGAGSEAISGLGRAFFYAGARALLVSSWPVETTSAKALTTDLFRRQSADPGLGRAEALRQTMNALIDGPGYVDPSTNRVVFSYAHPIFWAAFALVGDGGGSGK